MGEKKDAKFKLPNKLGRIPIDYTMNSDMKPSTLRRCLATRNGFIQNAYQACWL